MHIKELPSPLYKAQTIPRDRDVDDDWARTNFALFVVIPTLNEEKSVGQVIAQCKLALSGFDLQIIVVDGFSEDSTADIARRQGATVIHERAAGYGSAYLAGFDYVLSRNQDGIIVMIDGDSTYSAADIPVLLGPILDGRADLVIANRFADMQKGAMSFRNLAGNRIISLLVRKLYKLPISDSQSGFRAIRTKSLARMFLEAAGMPLATEMLIEARKLGLRMMEIPSSYGRRIGRSKINAVRDGYNILWTAFRLVSEYNPFLVYGTLAAMFLLTGGAFGAYAFHGWYLWMFFGANTWPRLGSSLLGVFFMITGILAFSLGILLDTLLRSMRAAARRNALA